MSMQSTTTFALTNTHARRQGRTELHDLVNQRTWQTKVVRVEAAHVVVIP